MPNKYYDMSMALRGAEEFKEAIKSIHDIYVNTKKHPSFNMAISNMLWIVQRGGGVTTMLNFFSEYLSSLKLHEFIGEEKFIEFKLGYNSADEKFSELKRLDDIIKKIAGHRYDFRGVLCVNIDEWSEYSTDAYFGDFLEFIAYNRNKIITVFTLSPEIKKVVENIEAVISSYMELGILKINFPEPIELLDLIDKKYIKPKGFSFSDDAKELLSIHIKSRIAGHSFDGFKNIERLAEGILICAVQATKHNEIITAKILSPYFEKQLKQTNVLNNLKGNKKTIGFSERKEY